MKDFCHLLLISKISAIQLKHHQKCRNERKISIDTNTGKDDRIETVTSDTFYNLVNLLGSR